MASTEAVEAKPEIVRHLHRCQECGTIWGHGHMMQRDIEAHKCPKCGKTEWRVYSGKESHAVRRGSDAGPRYTWWDYLRAVAPIVLLSAALVLSLLVLTDWLGRKTGHKV